MDKNPFLSNLDPAALDGVYQQYQTDPASVSPDCARFFEGFDLARTRYPELPGQVTTANADCGPSNDVVAKEF